MATGHAIPSNENKRNRPPPFKEKKAALLSRKSSLINQKKELNNKKIELLGEKKILDAKLQHCYSEINKKSELYNKIRAPLSYYVEQPLLTTLRRLHENLRINNFEKRHEARIVAEIDKLNRNLKELARLNDAKKELDEEKANNLRIKRQLSDTKDNITQIMREIRQVNQDLDSVSDQLVPTLSQPPRGSSGKSPQTPATTLASSFSTVTSKGIPLSSDFSASLNLPSSTPLSPITSLSFATTKTPHTTVTSSDQEKSSVSSSSSTTLSHAAPVRPGTLPLRDTTGSATYSDGANKCLTVPNIPTQTLPVKRVSETPNSDFKMRKEDFPAMSSSGRFSKSGHKLNRSATTPRSCGRYGLAGRMDSRGDATNRSRLDMARRLLNDLEALPIPKIFTPTTPQFELPGASQSNTPTTMNRRKGSKGFRGLTLPMFVFSSLSELGLPIPASWSDLQTVKGLARQLKNDLLLAETEGSNHRESMSLGSSGLGTPSLLRSISNTSTTGDSAFSEIPPDHSLTASPTALHSQFSCNSTSSNNSRASPPQSITTIITNTSSTNSEDSVTICHKPDPPSPVSEENPSSSNQQLKLLLIIPESGERMEGDGASGVRSNVEPGSSSLSDNYEFN